MNTTYPIYYPQFFTATIIDWKHLLLDNQYREIIIDILKFLVADNRIILNAFVIMSNHMHIIWQPTFAFTPSNIQASLLTHTAKQFKRSLVSKDPTALETYKVNKYDRTYQFWKREALSIELRTHAVYMQKLEYIHYNPVKAGLCINPEGYYYSSAKFYHCGVDDFGMLTHYLGDQ